MSTAQLVNKNSNSNASFVSRHRHECRDISVRVQSLSTRTGCSLATTRQVWRQQSFIQCAASAPHRQQQARFSAHPRSTHVRKAPSTQHTLRMPPKAGSGSSGGGGAKVRLSRFCVTLLLQLLTHTGGRVSFAGREDSRCVALPFVQQRVAHVLPPRRQADRRGEEEDQAGEQGELPWRGVARLACARCSCGVTRDAAVRS